MGGPTNESGVILEYSVNPRSIVLDSSIFGGVYGENEIIIDTTKSKLKYIQEHEFK